MLGALKSHVIRDVRCPRGVGMHDLFMTFKQRRTLRDLFDVFFSNRETSAEPIFDQKHCERRDLAVRRNRDTH